MGGCACGCGCGSRMLCQVSSRPVTKAGKTRDLLGRIGETNSTHRMPEGPLITTAERSISALVRTLRRQNGADEYKVAALEELTEVKFRSAQASQDSVSASACQRFSLSACQRLGVCVSACQRQRVSVSVSASASAPQPRGARACIWGRGQGERGSRSFFRLSEQRGSPSAQFHLLGRSVSCGDANSALPNP